MKTMFLFMAIALSFSGGYSQSNCGNLDFENGDFSNWTTYCGNVWSIDSITIPSFDTNRFMITTGGYDQLTGNKISTVSPGGNYSCRLGNPECGAEAEKITYSIPVNSQNTLFIYKYAIVLEDPGHPADDQPQFEVKILDENGNITDQTCGYYQVSAAAGIPGFQNFGSVIYKDWTTVGIDLTPYLGQTVTLSFTTKDCSQGGHFGYAYIDAGSSGMMIGTFACAGSDSLTLSAPAGFDYLWMPGGHTGRILVIPPSDSAETYNCTLTSVTGCSVTLSATTDIISVVPDFLFTSCDTVYFTGICLNDSVEISSWNWNFGDGENGTSKSVTHEYSSNGPFDVILTITSESGCVASVNRTVEVIQRPFARFHPETTCAGSYVDLNDMSGKTIPGVTSYFWDFGDGTYSASNISEKKFRQPGIYSVSLTVSNADGCDDKFVSELEIMNCEVEIPNVFTPNSDGENENFIITNLESCSKNNLTIFNRWGYPIYESNNYNNNWSPQNISPGVYYYVFEYSPVFPIGIELAKTGFVTVLR